MPASHKPLLLYQSYGSPEALHQTMLSLLSLEWLEGAPSAKYDAALYTDQPEFFKRFLKAGINLHLVALPNGRIAEWRGKNQYMHRLKIKMLEDCFRQFERDVLYVDSDTYFLAPPDGLFGAIGPEASVMFETEGDLAASAQPRHRRLARFLRKTELSLRARAVRIPAEVRLWSAAVVGLSYANRHFVPDVLALTDDLYGRLPSPDMEKLAFSHVLGQATTLAPANAYICHYASQRHARLPMVHQTLNAQMNLEGARQALALLKAPRNNAQRPRSGWFRW